MESYQAGRHLRVGDTIDVWWRPKRDTITALTPYHGPLAKYFRLGAQLATFASGVGMTIDNDDYYWVFNRTT